MKQYSTIIELNDYLSENPLYIAEVVLMAESREDFVILDKNGQEIDFSTLSEKDKKCVMDRLESRYELLQ